MYQVNYTDDLNKKHMAFVKTFSEVKFYLNRFYKVSYEKTNFKPRKYNEC